MGGVEERGFLKGSDRTKQECVTCFAVVVPPAMPHFTVVPVEDKYRVEYDSVEGLSWVDYRESLAAPASRDSYYTVSSDGEQARPGRGAAVLADSRGGGPAPLQPAVADKGGGGDC